MNRMPPWIALAVTATAVSAAPIGAQEEQTPPEVACAGEELRAFDFWLGSWRVLGPRGREVGSNRISRVAGGCALLEEWRSARGSTGTSLNTYQDGSWHQYWIGGDGVRLHLTGGIEGEAMVMSGRRSTDDGDVLDRVTWTPLEGGRVEQVWEQSSNEGATWTVAFEGIYERIGLDAGRPQAMADDAGMPGGAEAAPSGEDVDAKGLVWEAWRAVSEQYYDPAFGGADWPAIGGDYLSRSYDSVEAAHTAVREMLARLDNPATTEALDLAATMSALRVERSGTMHVVLSRDGRHLEISIEPERLGRAVAVESSVQNVGDATIGYIGLRLFNESAAARFLTTVRELEAQDVDAYVLDLRNNPGGYVNTLQQVAGALLGSVPLASIRARDGVQSLLATGERLTDARWAVLVNEGTASAAEVLASALQHHGRGGDRKSVV